MGKPRSEEWLREYEAKKGERKKEREDISRALRVSVDRETGRPVVGEKINKNFTKETKQAIRGTRGPTIKQGVEERKAARARGEKVARAPVQPSTRAKRAATIAKRKAEKAAAAAPKPTSVKKATTTKGKGGKGKAATPAPAKPKATKAKPKKK